MSDPYVSSYDQIFLDAFKGAINTVPEDQAKLVKEIVTKIHDSVIDSIFYYVSDEMKSNLDAAIRDKAAEVAKSMLMHALAGDDKQLRNLFGFNDWYMKHRNRWNDIPEQWRLIDALVERKPELFVSEKIAQQETDIAVLQRDNERLRKHINFLEGQK